MKNLTTSLILVFGLTVLAYGQNEGTLSFMSSISQFSYNNPAFVPKYRVSLGLPGSSVMTYYANNAFTYNKIVTRANDSTKVDLQKLSSVLKPKNYITQAFQVDLFRFSLKVNRKLYVTLNVTGKTYARLMLPKDLINLLSNGTTSFVGKSATLSPAVEGLAYIESAVGMAYAVDNKLTLGGRIKILKGVANVNTQSATMNLAVDNTNYSLTANANANIRTSGIYNFTQSNFNFSNSYSGYLKNNGMALDLGATYRLTPKITLGASLIDIGSINWTNNTYSYSLNPATASYTFQGIDLSKVINNNTNYLQAQSDSIQNKFKFKETAIGAYRAPIPGKMYLSGMYEVQKNLTVGMVAFAEKFQSRVSSGVTLGVNKHFGRVLSAAGSYTVASNSFNNLGLGLSLNLAPFQFYLVGDNLLLAAAGGKQVNNFVNNMQFFNLRTGLNFVLGWDKPQAKQPKTPASDLGLGKKKKGNYNKRKK